MKINKERRKYKKNVSQKWNLVENGQKIKPSEKLKAVKIESRKDAQNVPTPITTYALFCDGEYVTNEQMNDKKFLQLGSR